jgi:hypothetical protein
MFKPSLQPRHRNSGRPPEKSAPQFKEWLRKKWGCVFAGHGECGGKIEAMHLDFAGGKGMGTKVADRFSVPACSGHHGTQHRIGWSTFVALMATSKERLLEAAGDYWHLWPGRRSWEAKHGA